MMKGYGRNIVEAVVNVPIRYGLQLQVYVTEHRCVVRLRSTLEPSTAIRAELSEPYCDGVDPVSTRVADDRKVAS
jgi:hypothetical protein